MVEFDSYTKPSSNLELGEWRTLDVDNRAVVPFSCPLQIIVTRADVIHSFAVPSLSLKLDCNPGYLNSFYFFSKRPGVFIGMCRELCGAGHRNISIVIERVSLNIFKQWVSLFYF